MAKKLEKLLKQASRIVTTSPRTNKCSLFDLPFLVFLRDEVVLDTTDSGVAHEGHQAWVEINQSRNNYLSKTEKMPNTYRSLHRRKVTLNVKINAQQNKRNKAISANFEFKIF